MCCILRILEENLKKGFVRVVPETLDDLWHLYNVIQRDDGVYARTTREVKAEGVGVRPTKGKRLSVSLGIKVKDVSFDKAVNRLKVKGIVVEAPEDLEIKGTHHTIHVTPGTPVTVSKIGWSKYQLARLRTACEYRLTPIVIIALDDEDCCIAMLRHYGFDIKMELKTKPPGKLYAEPRKEGMFSYFKSIRNSLINVWKEIEGPIVIVGPSFMKKELANYLKKNVPGLAPYIAAVKSVSSAGIAGVHEAIRCGVLAPVTKRVRVAEETGEVEEVFSRLGKGRRDVAYSLSEVEKAVSYGAVSLLLIADRLLREMNNQERMHIEELARNVEEKGGRVMIVSTEHEAGENLTSLGGVAALLRFPIG